MKIKKLFQIALVALVFSIIFISCTSCSDRGGDDPTPTDTQKPTAPTGLVAKDITTSSFNINWTSSTDNVSVTGYNVYVNDVVIGSTSSTNYTVTGLTASTTCNVYVKAKDAAGNISDKSSTLNVTTVSNINPSASLLQPVIIVSSFRALQLNACSNENFTVAFSTSSAQRTLQSATFTLSGDGAGAYRSIRYRPAGDFTQPWKQVDFSGNSVTVPFSVIIPAGLTAKYDLKVCTKASVNGIVNGSNTSMQVSSITTDESGVNAPVGSTFQAAVSLPALDLATTATFITSTINAGRDASQLILSANQTISQYIVGQFNNIKSSGPVGMNFAGVTLKNIYGNSSIYSSGNWKVVVNNDGNYSNFVPNILSNGNYYNISLSNGLFSNNGNSNNFTIKSDITAGSTGYTSGTTFGFSLMSKWDVVFQNSNGNDINLTDNTVQDNGVTLTN